MNSLIYKDSQTLTSSDIENLALRFGGKREDYIEIVNNKKIFKQSINMLY